MNRERTRLVSNFERILKSAEKWIATFQEQDRPAPGGTSATEAVQLQKRSAGFLSLCLPEIWSLAKRCDEVAALYHHRCRTSAGEGGGGSTLEANVFNENRANMMSSAEAYNPTSCREKVLRDLVLQQEDDDELCRRRTRKTATSSSDRPDSADVSRSTIALDPSTWEMLLEDVVSRPETVTAARSSSSSSYFDMGSSSSSSAPDIEKITNPPRDAEKQDHGKDVSDSSFGKSCNDPSVAVLLPLLRSANLLVTEFENEAAMEYFRKFRVLAALERKTGLDLALQAKMGVALQRVLTHDEEDPRRSGALSLSRNSAVEVACEDEDDHLVGGDSSMT
ncbi:unnamed protein product, partial [Amoebophrya sp. A120]|eukprot:GSA120T00007337001.1